MSDANWAGTKWQHNNGTLYEVLFLTNRDTERPEQYPVTVVYRNVHNSKLWSRPLADWHRSFTKVS